MHENKAFPNPETWKEIRRLEKEKKENEIIIRTKGGFEVMDPRKIR